MQILGRQSKKIIKSIQRGTLTLGAVDLFKTLAIASVDQNKSIIRISSNNLTINGYDSIGQADFNSNTEVYISRNTNGTNQPFEYEIIEYSDIKSKQKGTVALSSSNQVITIADLDNFKSMCWSSCKTSAGTIASPTYMTSFIESRTSIRHKGYGVGSVIWQTIEHK